MPSVVALLQLDPLPFSHRHLLDCALLGSALLSHVKRFASECEGEGASTFVCNLLWSSCDDDGGSQLLSRFCVYTATSTRERALSPDSELRTPDLNPIPNSSHRIRSRQIKGKTNFKVGQAAAGLSELSELTHAICLNFQVCNENPIKNQSITAYSKESSSAPYAETDMCSTSRAVAARARLLVAKASTAMHNVTSSFFALLQFAKEHGLEADRSSLRHLFSVINLSDPAPSVTVQLQAKLLGTQLQRQLQNPSFVSNICFAFDQYFASNQKVSDLLAPYQNILVTRFFLSFFLSWAVTKASCGSRSR